MCCISLLHRNFTYHIMDDWITQYNMGKFLKVNNSTCNANR